MMTAHDRMIHEEVRRRIAERIEQSRRWYEITAQYDAGKITFEEYRTAYKEMFSD